MGVKYYINCIVFLLVSAVLFGQSSSMKKVNKIPLPKNKANTVTSVNGKKALINNAGKNLKKFLDRNGLKVNSPKVHQNNLTFEKFSGSSLNITADQFDIEKISWDEEFGTPRFIKVSPHAKSKNKNSITKNSRIEYATEFLINKKELLKVGNPADEFEVKNYNEDKLGKTHVKYQQTHNGLKVFGHEIIVHLDQYGNVESTTGRTKPSLPENFDINENIDKNSALQIAHANLEREHGIIPIEDNLKKMLEYEGPEAEKAIMYDDEGDAFLIWHVQIRSGLMHHWQYFVDAKNGDILNVYDNVCTNGPAVGTGYDLKGNERSFGTYEKEGIYHLMDTSQEMFDEERTVIPETPFGVIATYNWQAEGDAAYSYFTSENNVWEDSASVSAHKHMIEINEYFKDVFNRNSYDDNGSTIRTFVHYTQNGQRVNNASWNGRFMVFGDGEGEYLSFARALDVAAHELTHGVTNFSANLLYQDMSGALNESFSDVIAVVIDSLDWTLGEEMRKDGGADRDISNPHNGAQEGERGWQPATMSEYQYVNYDHGGVHINSGIPNKAFYNAASELGRTKAGKIWYRALNNYLFQLAQFIDARIATVQAAIDLHGEESPEVEAVKAAWDAVELYEGEGTPPPAESTLEGEENILFVNTKAQDFNSLYMADTVGRPALQSLSVTPISNKPAVSDTSGLVLFIDGENNLRALIADPAGPEEEIIDTSGVWSSVAIGPGLSSIAMTSIYIDTSVYYFNLESEEAEVYKVMNSTSEDVGLQTALFADALSFDPSGQYILMDSYNEIRNQDGDEISFWTLNILALNSGLSRNVYPPEEGVNFGNPSFSKMTTTRFTFDVWMTESKQNAVFATDIYKKIRAQVSPPDTVLGYPSYSANDRTVIYRRKAGITDILLKVPLENDRVTGIPFESEIYHEGGIFPVWFVLGSRITSVDDEQGVIVKQFNLAQNYPNPFNPSTTIEYNIPKKSEVSLKVYDLLGREVAQLVNDVQNAGNYKVNFDASDLSTGVYFYKISAGNFNDTKKLLLLK